MPKRNDIVGAIATLRSAGIDIVGDRGNPDRGDFGYSGGEPADDDDWMSGLNDDDDDDEISGADIIGAIIGAARGNKLTHKQKKALKKATGKGGRRGGGGGITPEQLASALSKANKPSVRSEEDFVLRGLTLGMGTVTVAATGVNKLTARAQEALRIQRIELDPNGASFANLFVSSIIVGVRPQSANLQDMPLIAFSFNATGSYLRGNTVDRGQDFEIGLRNGTAAAVNITGIVFGDSLQP